MILRKISEVEIPKDLEYIFTQEFLDSVDVLDYYDILDYYSCDGDINEYLEVIK